MGGHGWTLTRAVTIVASCEMFATSKRAKIPVVGFVVVAILVSELYISAVVETALCVFIASGIQPLLRYPSLC